METRDDSNGSGPSGPQRKAQVWYALIVDGKLYGLFPSEADARSLADSMDPKRGAVVRPVTEPWNLDLENKG